MNEETKKEIQTTPPVPVYEIQDEMISDPIRVYYSPRGWWVDRNKVNRLIKGFKMGFNVTRACAYTPISRNQYYHFIEAHPEFSEVQEMISQSKRMLAEQREFELIDKGVPNVVTNFLNKVRDKEGETAIPPGGTRTTLVSDSILNSEGKIVVRKQTASIEEHGDTGNRQE